MTSKEGCQVILTGWKAALITEAIERWTKGLGLLDPFFTVDPKDNNDNETIEEVLLDPDDITFFITLNLECEDEEVWEFKGEPLTNAFAIFNDDL